MLELKNISLSVEDEFTNNAQKEILRDINLTVETGKFIVITGPNGGGKSTMAKMIAGILQPVDTLEMAANAPTTDENYKKGVTMTLDKAAKALDALHVEEIEALGKPFDPNFMNAVQQIPAPDGQESGTVVTVYQKGYKLGDKIVRHATVVVAE